MILEKVAKTAAILAVSALATAAFAPSLAVADDKPPTGPVLVNESWLESVMADSKCGPGLQNVPSFWPVLLPIPGFLCPEGRATPAQDLLSLGGVIPNGITPVPTLPEEPDLDATLPELPNPVQDFLDQLQQQLDAGTLPLPQLPLPVDPEGQPLDIGGLPLFGGDEAAEDAADGEQDGHLGPVQLIEGVLMNAPVADGGTSGVVATTQPINISSDLFSAEGMVMRGAGIVQTAGGPEKVLVIQASSASLKNYTMVSNGIQMQMDLTLTEPTFYLRNLKGQLKLGLLPDIVPAIPLPLSPQLIPISLPVGLPLGPVTETDMTGNAALIMAKRIEFDSIDMKRV